MHRFSTIAIAAAVSILAFAAPAAAQRSSPAYGVDSLSTYVLSAWDMDLDSHSAQSLFVGPGTRNVQNGVLVGSIHLPQGARILSVELEGCDFVDDGGVVVDFARSQSTSSSILASIVTGTAATPGCGRFATTLETPETVDNDEWTYLAVVGTTVFEDASILALRFYYQLQVSPAPAVATFNDVPTSDPAFQFVEALAESGITAGCGANLYCPDAPLTRRQMAVFLSKALGLHFPSVPSF